MKITHDKFPLRAEFLPASSTAAAALCLFIYISSIFLSYFYILVTGKFNGDFHGIDYIGGAFQLTILMLACIAPLVFCFAVYRITANRPISNVLIINDRTFGILFFVIMAWNLFITYQYGVGILGKGIYSAPSIITPIIQITNRLNPYYFGCFFITAYRGDKKSVLVAIVALLLLGYMRASLGVLIYVALALAIRYNAWIVSFSRKNFFGFAAASLLVAIAAPAMVAELYNLRSEIREEGGYLEDLSASEVMAAKLAGRLSSLSNSGFVLQEQKWVESSSSFIDDLYFQKQLLAPVVGLFILPEVSPEILLVRFFNYSVLDNSYMAGVVGNLIFGYHQGPLIFGLNIISAMFIVFATFRIVNLIGLDYRNETCFMILLYPAVSGVAGELTFVLLSVLSIYFIFTLLALIGIGQK